MNLANKLSLIRIVLVPIMMFFYLASFIPFGKVISVVLFIAAALTDLFDGKIARKRNEVTDLGKLLDPLADKMLYTCAFFLILADGVVAPVWGVIALSILFVRDTLINGMRQIAASKGVVLAAAKSGKLKALLTDIYIPMFMFISQGLFVGTGFAACDVINQILVISAYVVMGIATVVTIYSGVDYVLKNKTLFVTAEDTGAKDNAADDKIETVDADEIIEAEKGATEGAEDINADATETTKE